MSKIIDQKLVVVGTRVYTGLYSRGGGTVFAIHGEQLPETITTLLGGAMVSGGKARFDIVFDNGSLSHDLPECVLRGVQWKIFDEVVPAEEITKALAHAADTHAIKRGEELKTKEAYAKLLKHFKTEPKYAHLTQGDDCYSGKLAASNIRIELKRAFPGVKFSVRKNDYGSVGVNWVDGPTPSQVEVITNEYKGGRFDSMEDIYEFSKSPRVAVFGGSKYLSTSRSVSLELVQKAIDAIFEEFPGNFEGIAKPRAEDYKNGQLLYKDVPGFNCPLSTLVFQRLCATSA